MTDSLDLLLGRWVGRLRERLHLSQEMLAQQLGVDQSTLSRIETGHRAMSVAELVRISNVLSVSDEELAELLRTVRAEGGRSESLWSRGEP